MIRQATTLLNQPGEKWLAHVQERLTVTHGAAVPFAAWLSQQPLVERSTLVEAFSRLRKSAITVKTEARRTSGSTGSPFSFLKDVEMSGWMDAVMWAVYSWHGVGPGHPNARFWGMPVGTKARAKRRVMDRLLTRRRLSAFEASPEQCVRFFHQLRRFRPVYSYGYPMLTHQFVHHCAAVGLDGRDLGLKVVICTGELLAPAVRKEMQDFFGCRIVNEYGCTESGVLSFECEAGIPHQVPVAALAEVVDSSGLPVQNGEVGEVVVTDLYGAVLPLRRYRLHDRAILRPAARCACGRELPILEVNLGRSRSSIQTPSRGPVYDAILAYTVPPGVQRFRVFQRSIDHIEGHIVAGTGFDPVGTPEECRHRWAEALGPGMRVTIQVVEDLPYAASGKLSYFVPLPEGGATGSVHTPS